MVKNEDANGNGSEHFDPEPEHFRKLFIGGLTPNTTEDNMKEFYGQWGDVVDVVVMRDPHTKRSRGFGFITYALKSQVDVCQSNRPHVIDGKTVDPKRAVPRDANGRGEANVSSKRLYVSGIREDHDENMLTEHFSGYGSIEKVDIVVDKATNKPRGFAFVTFTDYDAVDQCVLVKSHQINGYRCDVKKGLTKDEMAKAQQGERDRAERAGRSRGGPGGPGGAPGRGGAMGGGGGGAWAGQGWGAGGGGGMGGGGYGGGGRGGGGGAWGGQDQRGGQAGGWGGYGGGGGGYGGGYGQGGYGGQQAAGGAWGGDAWGQGGQQPAQQGWGQQQQQGGWGGAAAAGGGGGYNGGQAGYGGRGY